MLMQDQEWDENRGYLLPAHSELSGTWANRRMTSGEGTLWLRECLAARDIDTLDDIKRPTTHSCKATVLSWLAKAGNFLMSERQIMGHHLDRPSTSALTYGPQNFIPILTYWSRWQLCWRGSTRMPSTLMLKLPELLGWPWRRWKRNPWTTRSRWELQLVVRTKKNPPPMWRTKKT